MKRPTEKQEEHEWIERYLTDQMPADERTGLEVEMQTDPIFQQEVLRLQRTHKLMEEAFLEQRAVDTVKFLQRQSRRKMQRIRLISRSVMGVASLGFLLILYLSLSPVVFPNSENDINVTRNLSDDSSTVATAPNRVFSQFFNGQARLSEGQYALAVKNFQQVLTASDIRPYFREAAQWHLAFAYLKSGEPDKAERMYDQFTQCIDCEYPIGPVNRWKIWWQIKWAQWRG